MPINRNIGSAPPRVTPGQGRDGPVLVRAWVALDTAHTPWCKVHVADQPRQDWSRRLRTIRSPDVTIQVTYSDDSGYVDLDVTAIPEGVLSDLAHGQRSFCTAPATPLQVLHPLAVAGVSPGFLSSAHATNLALYTGATAPSVSGTFGVASSGGVGGGVRWFEALDDEDGRPAGPRYAARRLENVVVGGGANWQATDAEFIQADGGSGSNVLLPSLLSGTGRIYSIVVFNTSGAFPLPVDPGEYETGVPASIAGVAGPASLAVGGSWLLIGPDVNGDWKRFISA